MELQSHRGRGERWFDVEHEDGPPFLQQLSTVRWHIASRLHVTRLRIEARLPRLHRADEMHDLRILTKPDKSQQSHGT